MSLAICAMAGTDAIEAGVPGHRFEIDARVVPQQMPHAGGGLDLQAAVSAHRSNLDGSGYSLSASAIASPYECASDTIFASGFDP